MKKTIAVTAVLVLAGLAAAPAAFARPVVALPVAVQLRQGLAAFQRHDYARAGLLLQQPAEFGFSEAQSVLCYLYTYGRGVPQNYHVAAGWCRRAAEQGNPQGQYQLGILYSKGHGVPEDYVLAYKWLNLAAARASGPKRDSSYRIRDAVASKMSPAQVRKGQALAVEWQPLAEAVRDPLR